MFSEEEAYPVLVEGKLTRPVAEKLLQLHVADIDWWPHVQLLYKRLSKRNNPEKAKSILREAVAFTILLPVYDSGYRIDPDSPESLLFTGQSFHQFSKRQWFKELQKVVEQNQKITEYRKEALALGVIDPIDYQPYTRQAYKWLCDSAEGAGVELTSGLKSKFRHLVMVYGGAVVSNIYMKHKPAVNKIANWRSGYFFERLIFEVYDLEQVLKIKSVELNKTNDKWIRKPQVNN